ncbi:MAG TPA: glycoside hydrolase family 2 TIM barrel-domain containing protein [Streptosporangiaceae bacterium]|nr:glycoside hydrolase family 2 TIM barrel-domain containing protein [Streptosporangiaceae bacterium]
MDADQDKHADSLRCAGAKAATPSRRQVLRGAGAGLGAVALAPVIGLQGHPADASTRVTARASGSRSTDFGQGWKFALVNPSGITDPTGAYANAQDPGFDDSSWQVLDVPHDWSIELTPVRSASTSSSTGFLPGGLAWYRRHFTLPSSLAGKRISIEFDGVYRNSNVYLNGKLLGNHPYAYTGFSYDLTGLVHTDGRTADVIAVSAADQQPSSRWYSGDGIFRNVYLVVTDPVHVARHGTFVTTPDLPAAVAAGYATVQVKTDISNDGSADAAVLVAATVASPAGKTVAQGSATVSVAAGQTQSATIAVKVANPELWSTENPSLYGLRTDLSVSGGVVDAVATTFGIRYFAFDPAGGFSLNGRYLKIQGVDLHATEGAVGSAVRYDALARQMELMKSMGVNALRTAHNPPAPELVQVCERLGIVMMVEAFDCWHTGKLPYDYHLYFDQWSDSDIKEMVNASKNSPAVVLWSIGNETPDTGSSRGPGIARQLVADIKSIDTTRPVVMGSDKYRSVPSTGSPQEEILAELDGLGVNYNTAMSMDGLHAKYPGTFFFCSEMGSETSSRGVYQDPQLLNTGENYTPGKRATSSYDNNLASWTMSGEYELKKDRDRKFWTGGFLWSGQDYIGEPTPYDVFPVKASFFGAMDTAGFPKDAYYLFRSQWSTEPMVHIVPMNWTSYPPGEQVSVWVYANVATVELFLNGKSLGVRSFDQKVTTYGRKYLETTEPTGDDYNYPSGSYTSPNGSTGKLHLTWTVPFQPGTLSAVATAGGRVVARDEIRTAGAPHALTLTPDKQVITADGTSLAFVAVEVTDQAGVVVPDAGNLIRFGLAGPGTLDGVDNGQQENAQSYRASSVPAFNGKALVIVRSTGQPGSITVTATSAGLGAAKATIRSAAAPGQPGGLAAAVRGTAPAVPAVLLASPASAPTATADASYSGSPATVPAAMLDGDLTTGWSNYYDKSATANLHAVSVSRAADWVSVSWPGPRSFGSVVACFTTSATLALPASITVSYWDGGRFVPVRNLTIDRATAANQPTTLTFDPVRSSQVRLDMTSPAAGTGTGFLQIAELRVLSNGVNIA